MIYIVANRPKKNEQREGYLQRVRAIDGLLVDEDCVYHDDFTDPQDRKNAMLEASTIYVHSIHNAEKIIKLYPPLGHKIITDMHGVVPEEELLSGNNERATEMDQIESEVIRYGKYFVAVTSAMIEHYAHKYDVAGSKQWIVLPIFNDELELNTQRKTHTCNNVIYSGGAQKWQNCKQMIRSVSLAKKKVIFTILSNDLVSFRGLIARLPALKNTVKLKSVANSEIASYYDRSDMGFVLRDDSIINRVACPTKIIEYMKRGVVPIIQFDEIGDFKALGYEYIKCKDFEDGNYSSDQLSVAAVHNVEVLSKLESISKNGTRELVTIIANLRALKSVDETQALISKRYIDNLTRIEQIETELQTTRGELLVAHARLKDQEQLIHCILNSKRWRFGEVISYPQHILKSIGHKLKKQLKVSKG